MDHLHWGEQSLVIELFHLAPYFSSLVDAQVVHHQGNWLVGPLIPHLLQESLELDLVDARPVPLHHLLGDLGEGLGAP